MCYSNLGFSITTISSETMALSFHVREHRILGQHIREYPGATAQGDDDALQIEIKQYIPIDNPTPEPGDVTIIATHANAHCKELYEPLWEELHARSSSAKFRIRSIWVADIAQQGASYIANESKLGNDPHWFDHSRDLLRMIDHFREQMPRPIVGVGHSAGGAQIIFLSHIHPRLFHSLVLIEPSLNIASLRESRKVATVNFKYAFFRKDVWPSRSKAAAWISKNPFYKGWDPRVISQLFRYGLRQTPTLLHPNADADTVTLRTPKHQEAFLSVRPRFNELSMKKPASAGKRNTDAGIDPNAGSEFPFDRFETRQSFSFLETLRPSVLFIHGDQSFFTTPDVRAARVRTTGTGPSGNGGTKLGRVKEVVLPGGHFVVMELVNKTATSIADYMGGELQRWKEEEQSFKEQWERRDPRQKQMLDERWIQALNDYESQRKEKSKL